MSGLVVEIAIVLIVGAIAALIAARRRTSPLFAAYAKARGMTLISSDRARLPDTTPLLRKGERATPSVCSKARSPATPKGLLANYTYVETAGSAEVRRRFTIAYQTVPESVPLVPELFVRPKAGPSALEGIEDALGGPRTRGSSSRARHSTAHMRSSPAKCRTSTGPASSSPPPSSSGWWRRPRPASASSSSAAKLCCHVDGHAADADTLDRVAAANVAVARRLREEAAENVSR